MSTLGGDLFIASQIKTTARICHQNWSSQA
jgi:hypothetical protein